MKAFIWSNDKNKLLQQERNISFEDIVEAIANGYLLDSIENPNEKDIFRRLGTMQHIEEQDLLESIENDKWVSISNKQEELFRFQNMAKQQILKQKIELQMSTQDSDKIYSLANQLGMSVPSFVQNIVHKYLQGELVEKR